MAPKLPPPPASPGGAAAPGEDPDFIGVPDDYSVPPTLGDWFRPERQIIAAGQLQGATSTFPQYQEGTQNVLLSMSAENIARLQAQLSAVGLIGPETRFRVGVVTGTSDPTYTAFKKLLATANVYGTTWDRALNILAEKPAVTQAELDAEKEGGQKFDTTGSRTDTTTSRFTKLDAEAAADAAFQEALGQDASPKQAAALRKALNAYAKANPTVSTTDSTYDPETGRELTSTTQSTGGISEAGARQIATNIARQAPNYAEVQAATTYMNALEAASESPVDL